MRIRPVVRTALVLVAAGAATAGAQPERTLTLSMPVDCKVGETCFIQHYFDHDPSPQAKDYRCGTMTYDGHDGVDLRVPTTAAQQQGVTVVAAAMGTVRGTRDGMADISVRATGGQSVSGRECGNGVVLAHEGGWETQYCHMARASVRVRTGQRVDAGTPLGLVGMSGEAEFPHLHFSVRRNGVKIDPFATEPPLSCDGARALWSTAAAAALIYRSPAVINAGFAAGAVTSEDIESGQAGSELPTVTSPFVVAFVRAIGLKAGDIQILTLKAPDGAVLARSEVPPLDRNMAQRFMFVGKRKSAEWPHGTYNAEFEVRRDGATAVTRHFSFDLH